MIKIFEDTNGSLWAAKDGILPQESFDSDTYDEVIIPEYIEYGIMKKILDALIFREGYYHEVNDEEEEFYYKITKIYK